MQEEIALTVIGLVLLEERVEELSTGPPSPDDGLNLIIGDPTLEGAVEWSLGLVDLELQARTEEEHPLYTRSAADGAALQSASVPASAHASS